MLNQLSFKNACPAESLGRAVHYLITCFFWLCILLGVLSHGANYSLGVIAEAAGAAVILIVLIFVPVPQATRVVVNFCLAVILALIVWVAVQTWPVHDVLLAHPAWQNVRLLNGASSFLSVTPGDDFFGLIKSLTPFSFFLAGLFLFQTDEDAIGAVKTIGIGGGMIAVLSLLQFILMPDVVVLSSKTAYVGSLTGPFINRNTAATFFGLITLIIATMTWTKVRHYSLSDRDLSSGYFESFLDDFKRRLLQAVPYLLLLVSAVLALVLTGSRAGIVAVFISLCALTILEIWLGYAKSEMRGRRQFGRKALSSAVILLLLLVGFGVLAGRVALRVEAQGLDDARFCVAKGLLAAIWDTWPLGSGISSFQTIFPGYRNPVCGLRGTWDKAHNFYLEGFLTLGVVFPILLLAVLACIISVLVYGIRSRRRYRSSAFLGVSVLILVLLHSALDFSMQVPGFAIFFAAVLAPLLTLCLRPPGSDFLSFDGSSNASRCAM